MASLIIVESPTKIHTIQKTLGSKYKVVACVGHIRDLPKSKLGIDIEHDFTPTYVDIKGKEKVIDDIKKLSKKADRVYFATDPDREGEAISWHLATMLGFDLNDKNRVTFNEITKSGVEAGIASPRSIDMNIVNAQQTRRILDRIVGYKLSPFLWKKVRRGLSAGRVQSVAVRMIVDREEEIRSFVPVEYWSVEAKFLAKSARKAFAAKLATVDGKKAELKTKEETDEHVDNWADRPHRRKRFIADIVSNDPSVHHIIELLKNHAAKQRQTELPQHCAGLSHCKILVHGYPPFCIP